MFDAVMEHFEGFYPHGYYHGESIINYRDYIKKHRRIEVGFGGEYSVGGIYIDENMMTGVPGLYAAGEVGCGAFGANRVADAVVEMIVQGYKAGEVAAQRSAGEVLVEAEKASVAKAVGTLEKILSNKGGITVKQAKERLQSISDATLKLLRNEQTLAKGVSDYEALKEEMDNISITAKGLLYNRELLEALQLRNLLTCSTVSAKMALMRKESRGVHLREDYPLIDNVDWQVRLVSEQKCDNDNLSTVLPVVTKIPMKKAERIDYGTYVMTEDLGMKNQEDAK